MRTNFTSYNFLKRKIKKYKVLKLLFLFTNNLLNAGFWIVLSAIPLISLELLLEGDRSFRSFLFAFMGMTSLGWLSFYLFPFAQSLFTNRYKVTLHKVALEIGNAYPEIHDRLLNSLQLMEKVNSAEGVSKEFILRNFDNIFQQVQGKDFSAILEKKKLRNSLVRFIVSLLIFLFLYSVFPNFGNAFYRVIHFNKSFIPPAPFSLKIYPKYGEVKKGESVVIKVQTFGIPPKTISLKIREYEQENFESIPLDLDSGNIFQYQIASIKRSIKFFAEANWMTEKVQSDIGEIAVVENPMIKFLKGTIIFPSYANKPQIIFTEQNPDISALFGSRIKFFIKANKKLSKAFLVLIKELSPTDSLIGSKNDTVFINFNVRDEYATSEFIAKYSGSYYIQLFDLDGNKIQNPIRNKLIVEKDQPPKIDFLEPKSDIEIGENSLLPMMVFISDDFGFSSLRLFFRLSYSDYSSPWKEFRSIKIPFNKDENFSNGYHRNINELSDNSYSLQIPYIWDLSQLNISPSDEFEFFAEVADNDVISGPKISKTQILRLKLPSLEEVLRKTDQAQESITKELNNVLKQANEVKEEMQELQRELNSIKKKKELDWQEKKKAENLMNSQKQLAEKLGNIQKSLENLIDIMNQKDLLSPETLQKYQELQRLLKEINSSELKELQRQYEQAISKLSSEEIQNALKNYQFDEEQFRKNIERTLKLLKRLQAEQKIDALLKRANELERKLTDLQNQTVNQNPADKQIRDELANKQNELQEEFDKIAFELKELQKLMDEIGKDAPVDELKEAEEELNASATRQEMQNAQNNLKVGNFANASKSQQRSRNQIQKFAQKLKKVKDEFNNRVAKEILRKLQKALKEVLDLSNDQSRLMKKTQNIDYNSTLIPELAREESSLSDAVGNIANLLFELSQKSFIITPEMARSIGESIQSMQEATKSLINRNLNNAQSFQNQAIKSLNNTALQMQSMLSALQGQGSCDNPGGEGGQGTNGSNFMQKLQQIASAQQSINQITQQLAQGNQGSLSREQQAQLARIVADQGRAQKALEDLANEQKKFSRPEERILGNLRRISEDMKEVVSKFQKGSIDTETLKLQERILSRLLDATKSMYERDFEERRESAPGREIDRISPPVLDFDEQQFKTLDQLLKYLKQSYTKDYEELVRKYFLYLKQLNLKPTSF